MTTEIEQLKTELEAARDDIRLWKQRARLWENRAKRNAKTLTKVQDLIDAELYE